MRVLLSLYQQAQRDNIPVESFRLPQSEAASVMDREGNCYIAIDPARLDGPTDEKMKLSHELGHCETGSFYNPHSPCDLRERHEERATRWQIRRLIPRDELERAVRGGMTEVWELADYFSVPPEFVAQAVEYYETQRKG